MFLRVNWKTHIRCMAFALILITAAINPLKIVFVEYFPKRISLTMVRDVVNDFYTYLFIIIGVTSILHMFLHGFTYRIFGGSMKFGIKFIYRFTESGNDMPMNRTKLLIVLLCPMMIISFTALLIPGWIGKTVFYVNLIGATSDVYAAIRLCAYNRNSSFIARYNGYDIANSK